MDLYFAGNSATEVMDYLKEHNANKLYSQLLERKAIEKWLKDKPKESKLFIDSGAFSAYTKQSVVDVDDYIDYVNSFMDDITIFAQVDKIPGEFRKPKTPEQLLEAPRLSWENYLYMKDKVKDKSKLVPVFHQGDDYKWLKNMLEYVDSDGQHIPYIGISPAVDVKGLLEFLDTSFEIIAESSNPNVKTHAFGMTRLDLLEIYPYTSADSTSWIMMGAMGSIYTPWGPVYVSDVKKNDYAYISHQPEAAFKNLCSYIESLGFTFEEVQKSNKARVMCNAMYLLNWAKNYQYKGRSFKKNKLF